MVALNTAGFSGDYNPTSDLYRFNQGALRSCVDIQIFRDNSFEPDEDFFGQIQGFQLPSGMFEPTIQGVTVQPSETRVVIEDMDGNLSVQQTLVFKHPSSYRDM